MLANASARRTRTTTCQTHVSRAGAFCHGVRALHALCRSPLPQLSRPRHDAKYRARLFPCADLGLFRGVSVVAMCSTRRRSARKLRRSSPTDPSDLRNVRRRLCSIAADRGRFASAARAAAESGGPAECVTQSPVASARKAAILGAFDRGWLWYSSPPHAPNLLHCSHEL